MYRVGQNQATFFDCLYLKNARLDCYEFWKITGAFSPNTSVIFIFTKYAK